MPLETATYISELVVTNPANSDGLNQADDHMRLIKSAVKATFPNFTAAALSATQAELDAVADLLVSGVIRGNGAVPAGAIMDFGMTAAPTGWLACDGQAVSRTTYADLFAAIGTLWGAGDGSTTFNVPPLTSRFRRHRDNSTLSFVVGTMQTPCNLSHTHTYSGTSSAVSNDHNHTYSGTTAGMNANTSHTHGIGGATATGTTTTGVQGGGTYIGVVTAGGSLSISATDTNHAHDFSGTTSGISANHTHTYSGTTSAGSADGSEVRPYSATVLTCIKT